MVFVNREIICSVLLGGGGGGKSHRSLILQMILKSTIYLLFFFNKMKSLNKHVIDPIAGNSIWNINLCLRLQKLQESSKQPRLPLNQMLLTLTETPVDLCEND